MCNAAVEPLRSRLPPSWRVETDIEPDRAFDFRMTLTTDERAAVNFLAEVKL
ncbi:hypothetical protein [Mycolicibacterium vulneris]|uniref:hypothetical protein n=1 Tax=Mycolicibacterium vulneris TaxID=547163 RepID=UPI001FEBDCA7|nr:hypothetical protein [Mycolicibacterium vulneris]